METLMRNGVLSFNEGEMALNSQWVPPGDFMTLVSEQLENVAEAEVDIYHRKETGILHVIIREVSNLPVIHSIIEYVYNAVTGLIDTESLQFLPFHRKCLRITI